MLHSGLSHFRRDEHSFFYVGRLEGQDDKFAVCLLTYGDQLPYQMANGTASLRFSSRRYCLKVMSRPRK
ncbi:hypothetical protein WJ0W_001205 [Paenibacillus melissococcoides]|uniref:Uncharacterized protein n=1 Tax=Paenibacillus melissococcoides TaxID=2912268 RepID=A0ABM9FXN1_9BACL|nr:hypothetical protein [Paenibacillus melissococcoides]MEB9893297.1 hypothetical protein [Bacillus cereus]CAH8243966.1 hypothetical protein WJ0W_001205 [Paenibacillus melissococcoides]CAH8704124.1 hypothetical protein HTL2_000453 [Paenibacillus melissococcoides]CAH8706847.1 hypothetical protein WDD9_001415 [Paenibacillus melissococcoides]